MFQVWNALYLYFSLQTSDYFCYFFFLLPEWLLRIILEIECLAVAKLLMGRFVSWRNLWVVLLVIFDIFVYTIRLVNMCGWHIKKHMTLWWSSVLPFKVAGSKRSALFQNWKEFNSLDNRLLKIHFLLHDQCKEWFLYFLVSFSLISI
jgi:hypothetical protein